LISVCQAENIGLSTDLSTLSTDFAQTSIDNIHMMLIYYRRKMQKNREKFILIHTCGLLCG
jgi:hypothetical protein